MPSRQRKQPENRRRTGCFQCKEKHVQCTEEKPSCKRCERLGLQCVRGIRLLFREDAIERGIHFGREGTWSKRCKRIKKPPVLDIDSDFTGIPLDPYFGKWIWLNTTYTDFSGDSDQWDDIEHATDWMLQVDDEQGPWTFAVDQNESCGEVKQEQQHQRQKPYRIAHEPLRTRSLGNPLSYYPHSEAYLLDYFINAIGPNCSLSSSRNPYMSLIPLFSSTTLRNTILAVSANQLFLLGDTRYFREASLYKEKAVTGLTQVDGTSTVDFDIVASVLMLCFHDISDNCLPSWVTHLRGGLHMTPYLPARSAQQEGLKRFFNMYFVAHDIMTRTAPIDYDDGPQHEWLENDDLDEIDTTVGCSRKLMTLVSQISSLARKRRSAQVLIDNDFVDQCETVRRGLETLQQKLPLAISSPKESFILQIAEIKRLTALLYFTENLGDLVPASPLPVTPFGGATTRWSFENDTPSPRISSNSSTSSSKSSSSSSSSTSSPISLCKSWASTKQRLVSAIIELIKALPNSNTASIMWPLYIIGHSAGLEDEDQRRFVLERLTAIQATRNLGNVRQVRLSVERNFRTMHLDLPTSMPKGRGTEVFRKRSGPTANERIISLA